MPLYPFMPGAKAALSESLNDSDVKDAVTYLKQSVADGVDAEGLWANDGRHVKMYALAKALLSCCSEHVKHKFAVQKAREYVQRANRSGDVLKLGHWFFSSLKIDEFDSVFLSVSDYLSVGQHLSSMEVSDGWVRVPPAELNALLSARIVAKFMEFKAQGVPEFIRDAAKTLDELPPVPKSFGLKFLELGCIRHVRQGIGEGKRFYGAMGLAIASQRDALQKEQAQIVMDVYVNACSGTKPFASSEGKSVVDWVYGRQIGFSCKKMMDDGFEGEYCKTCPINWKKRGQTK